MRDGEDDNDLLSDEEVPKRRRGRPVRAMGPDALKPPPNARVDSARCRECPKHDAKRVWCPIRAAPCAPQTVACKYGIVLIRAKRQQERRDG